MDELHGGLGRTFGELGASERMARDLVTARQRLADLVLGGSPLPGVAGAVAQARKAMDELGGFLPTAAARASAVVEANGGVERMLRQQREMERLIDGFGGINGVRSRHSAMSEAIGALGGQDAILRRHDEMVRLASVSRRTDPGVSSASFAASTAVDRAMQDVAGVTSFTGLLARGGFDGGSLDALVSRSQAWRAEGRGSSLDTALRMQLPNLFPERRRATASDLLAASLSPAGERFIQDVRRLASVRERMLRLDRPWIDVRDPGRSIAAYVDASALAAIIDAGPPQSRAVVAAVRSELGDYRETDPVSEVVASDPVLRSAFRLDAGYDADLSFLAPAVVVSIFGGSGGTRLRSADVDPDALAGAVHQRSRRLELRLRRFIERRMLAAYGPRWSKQRVPGNTIRAWRNRRQTDIDNGRVPSRLFDYAGFEDYRAIIEHKGNWAEVFSPVFKVKTSILETLRRFSLLRNPAAHHRVVTIEDFIDLQVEGRRLDAWLDGAD